MRFQGLMHLVNLNPRPEKAGKGKGDGAADIKVVGKVHLEQLKPLLSEHGFAMLEGMYDANGNLRAMDFEPFKLTKEFPACHMKLSTEISNDSVELGKTAFNQFEVEPEINRTVKFSARLQTHPSPEDVSVLFTMMDTDVTVIVEETQSELPLTGGGPSDDQAEPEPTEAPAPAEVH